MSLVIKRSFAADNMISRKISRKFTTSLAKFGGKSNGKKRRQTGYNSKARTPLITNQILMQLHMDTDVLENFTSEDKQQIDQLNINTFASNAQSPHLIGYLKKQNILVTPL
eukprot:TRINITY_DN483_c0_g2_i1.p1 TRINITY_DN483_c0_g2~~TRINITY_DN483_c0_g2_i1.p1  ORF type:complete len:111 (+),score=33.00 TRINITY_DN483_c0_g2_i1:662-994(+)